MFVLILTYTQPLAEIEKKVVAHREYLAGCYAKGLLICSGPQVPRAGGVIIANVTSKEEVDDLIQNDPFFQSGLAEYQVIEFDPVLQAKGFDTFLKNNSSN